MKETSLGTKLLLTATLGLGGGLVWGVAESLLLSGLPGQSGEVSRSWFVLGSGLWYALVGLLVGLALGLGQSLFGKGKGIREALAVTCSLYLGLVVLALGGFWVNVKLLPGIRFYSLPSLLWNLGVILATGVVLVVGSKLLRRVTQRVDFSRVVPLLAGLVVLILFLSWGGGALLATTAPGKLTASVAGRFLLVLGWGVFLALLAHFFARGLVLGCSSSSRVRNAASGWKRGTVLTLALLLLALIGGGFAARGMRPSGTKNTIEVGPGKGSDLNIILIVVDALRPDHLSCYGYPKLTSPTVDRIAREGTLFEQTITAAPFTWPAMASMFTSTYPPFHGVRTHADSLRFSLVTLAEVLQAKGYSTGAVISHTLLTPELGYAQGFSHYEVSDQPFGGPFSRLLLFQVLSKFAPPPLGDDARSVTQAAEDWITKSKDKKFFLWIHYADVHGPYHPPREFLQRFKPVTREGTLTEKEKEIRDKLANLRLGTPEEMEELAKSITPEMLEYNTALYDAEIAYVDAELEKLLQTLKELGILDKTLLVFTSDHGQSMGEHGQILIAHGPLLYDNTVMTPLILRKPGLVPAGKRVSQQVRSIDIMPTLLELAGIDYRGRQEGRSLVPLWTSAAPLSWPEAYIESEPYWKGRERYFVGQGGAKDFFGGIQGKRRALRSPEWKLIYFPKQGEHLYELYDLKHDPGELHNLYRELPQVADSLRRRLIGWIVAAESGYEIQGGVRLRTDLREKLRALGYVD